MREAIAACRERLFAVVGRLHGCWQPRARPSSPCSGRCHDRLALAGLDHHEARAVEGQLEGLARAAPNEGAHLEAALDLRLQDRRPADCRLRVNEGRLLRAVQKQRRPVGGRGLRLIQWWCLAVECCGRGKTPRSSFVYDIAMGKHLLHGRRVSDEQIQAWADEAEAGYDLRQLPRPTPGRPPVGRGPGVVVTVRLDEELLAALLKRAADEGIANRSDAVRAAVKQWAHAAA